MVGSSPLLVDPISPVSCHVVFAGRCSGVRRASSTRARCPAPADGKFSAGGAVKEFPEPAGAGAVAECGWVRRVRVMQDRREPGTPAENNFSSVGSVRRGRVRFRGRRRVARPAGTGGYHRGVCCRAATSARRGRRVIVRERRTPTTLGAAAARRPPSAADVGAVCWGRDDIGLAILLRKKRCRAAISTINRDKTQNPSIVIKKWSHLIFGCIVFTPTILGALYSFFFCRKQMQIITHTVYYFKAAIPVSFC